MSLALHFDNPSTELRTRLSTSVKPFVRLRGDLRTGFTNEHEKKKKLVKFVQFVAKEKISENSCNSWQRI